MTDYQRDRLKQLLYNINDVEPDNDIKQATLAIKYHILMMMQEAYLCGWKDAGLHTDELASWQKKKGIANA